MLLLIEEIAVESAMIMATLAALGLFVFLLADFVREHTRARQVTGDRPSAPSRNTAGRHG